MKSVAASHRLGISTPTPSSYFPFAFFLEGIDEQPRQLHQTAAVLDVFAPWPFQDMKLLWPTNRYEGQLWAP